MNKPASMSLTDFFTKKVALKTLVSESTVEAIIKHQWKTANEATKKNEEVEISGLGKFYVSKTKTLKRIENLERIKRAFQHYMREAEDQRKRDTLQNKINAVETRIKDLKAKIEDDQY